MSEDNNFQSNEIKDNLEINQNIEKIDNLEVNQNIEIKENLEINQNQEIVDNLEKNQNQELKNNLEINRNPEIKKQDNIIEENEQSFNQLLSLQLLIQKQSGLKELCKLKKNFIFNFSHKRKRRCTKKNKRRYSKIMEDKIITEI